MRSLLFSPIIALLSIALYDAASWLPVTDGTDDLVFWLSYMFWPATVFMVGTWLVTRQAWAVAWKVPLVIVAGIVIHSIFFLLTVGNPSYVMLEVPTFGTIGAALVALLMGWGMGLDRNGLFMLVLRSTFAGFVSSLVADMAMLVVGNIEAEGRELAYAMVSVIFIWQFGTGTALMWPLKRAKAARPAN